MATSSESAESGPIPIRIASRNAMGRVRTRIQGMERRTSHPTWDSDALRRTKNSVIRKIVRTRRMNVYAAKPSRKGGQISRRTDFEMSLIGEESAAGAQESSSRKG